jgi:FlaA1/EpsC-like NDP-sugar epimerase
MILDGKRILVTGGTGSLGQVLTRRILSGDHGAPRKVIVLSRDEAKQHEMRVSYLHQAATTDEVIYENFRRALEFRIGDVRSFADVSSAVRDADIVVNAAALKQVPTCEYFPDQALLTNCEGPTNIVRAIREQDLPVETVVGVSTDKACQPVNVMGMTKALQERIFVAANVLLPKTRFLCVRYGNVLASRGSVIPLFHEQIRRGGPVTVTVPEMTRFLLSLDQAVDTVFAAIAAAGPGETWVPASPAARIGDLARALVGERPIEIREQGIRPGEKMHELLVSSEECHHTHARDGYYVIAPMLPELAQRQRGEAPPPVARELSSADVVIAPEEVTALLRRHQLLVEQVSAGNGELLR